MSEEKEYFNDFPEIPGITVIPWFLWAAIIVLAIFATGALAAPMAQTATADGATIVLFDEPCKLKEVTNLKYRATWKEKGKTFEGCYAVHPFGVVVAYFNDGAVALMPIDSFQKVQGA
jgi:hypothetical protein